MDRIPLLELGRNMRRARERRLGIRSQSLLAARMGVSQSDLSRWENGRREPGVIDFLNYARVCGAPVEELLRGVNFDRRQSKLLSPVRLEPVMELDPTASRLVLSLVKLIERRSRNKSVRTRLTAARRKR